MNESVVGEAATPCIIVSNQKKPMDEDAPMDEGPSPVQSMRMAINMISTEASKYSRPTLWRSKFMRLPWWCLLLRVLERRRRKILLTKEIGRKRTRTRMLFISIYNSFGRYIQSTVRLEREMESEVYLNLRHNFFFFFNNFFAK
jgi:hypothetical protein